MFIYRENKNKDDESGKANLVEILIEKHRNGPTGKVDLYFNPQKVCFSSIEKGNFDAL